MDIKKVAITSAIVVGSFVSGVGFTNAYWKGELRKFNAELEMDAKKRREELRYKHPNYADYYRQNKGATC